MSKPLQDKSEELLKIGDLAHKLGVTTRTLRYYEEIRLIPPAHRLEGGARVYDKGQIKRLRFILKLKEFGISLNEMFELSTLYEVKQAPEDILPRTLELLDQHVVAIDAKIKNIKELKSQILEFRGHIVNRLNENTQDENL